MQVWNAGIAGLADDRIWLTLRDWTRCPAARVVAASDPDPAPIVRAGKLLRIRRFYPTWQEMLASEDLHFLHVGVEPRQRPAVVEEAAARGIHCLVEGPMAASLEGAEQMISAARRYRTRLLVNWPFARRHAVVHLVNLALHEMVGPIRQVWVRSQREFSSDWTPSFSQWLMGARASGGGALIEGCSHGASLCRGLLGVPQSCSAAAAHLSGEEGSFDDAALLSLHYPSTLVSIDCYWGRRDAVSYPEVVVRGTEGSLILNGGELQLSHGSVCEPIPVLPLSPEDQSAPWQLVNAAAREMELEGLCNPQVGRDTQEILEAAILSAERGQVVRFPLR